MAASRLKHLRLWRSIVGFRSISTSPMLCADGWNKDWKPGPYPNTKVERMAAAKKYGMRYGDYEPYPDDGFGYGDYPKLPTVSESAKDPYTDWDMPSLKRNFGEPVHVDAELMTEDKWDPDQIHLIPMWKMFLVSFSIFGGFGLAYYLTFNIRMFHPVMPQQLPYGSKGDLQTPQKHYTFEAADAE